MRGHGRSEKKGPYNWQAFGDDLTAFVGSLSDLTLIGVGHSMGGHAVAVTAARCVEAFKGLILIDPVIMSPEIYAQNTSVHADWLDEAGQHPVARRKNRFDSVEAMLSNFKGRGSYGVWEPEVLRDYCEHGLLADPAGQGLTLACPPEVEAEIYMGSTGRDILGEIAAIQAPVSVLRAKARDVDRTEMDFSSSPTWDGLADFLPKGQDVHLPELTHFIPMQAPGLVAEHIRALIK
jgi:pimeloyl-ACP methyl ester carboxylesterase